MTLKAMNASEITEPGAYEWVSGGMRHVGFLRKERRGGMTGSFISEEGSSRALNLQYHDGAWCDGVFYGPIPPSAPTTAA